MCECCKRRDDRDRAMWEAVRLGLVGIQRGLGAIVKAIAKRYDSVDTSSQHRRTA